MTDWADRNSLLRDIISVVGEEGDLHSLLCGVARLVVGFTDGDACFVHVVDRDTAEVVLRGATPDEFELLAGQVRLPLGEGLAGWVAAHGEPVLVQDKWSDPRYRYIPELRGERYNSLASIPLVRPTGHTVGVMNVHARRAGHFDLADLTGLEEVASLLAGVVEAAVLNDQLRRREADLEAFAVRTIELQELDRRRIAGDIHDGISQRLVSAWYHLRAAMSMAADEAVQQELSETASLLSEALEDSRRAITGLRPALLDDLGLSAAITSVVSSIGDVDATVEIGEVALLPHVETALFRIVQETLQNVVKHAKATRVDVRLDLDRDNAAVLCIADDGVGFDPTASAGLTNFGLAGMHERAVLLGARLTVRSAPGDGTTVTVTVPERLLAE